MSTSSENGVVYSRLIAKEGDESIYELFIGPQHPSSGHMRFIVRLEGDIIVSVDPDIGYVHRTMEKLAEGREVIKAIPLLERMTIIDSHNVTLGLVLALEKLLDVEAPPRAQYLRVLLSEINRISSHLYGLGIAGIMLNHSTMFMWAFGDREVWIQLAEDLTGARLTHTYSVPGGVRRDMPQAFPERAEKAIRYMERRLKDYMEIFLDNPQVRSRYEGVGVLKKSEASRLGIVGPNLRASGVKYDARLAEGYAAYPDLEFEIPMREDGDCLARMQVRVEEIRQSMSLIRQVIKKLPQGPIFAEKYTRLLPPAIRQQVAQTGQVKFPGIFASLKLPEGDAVSRVEMGHGEIFYHVTGAGSTKPYRLRVVTPSFRNVILFRYLMPGHRFMDFPAIYGSLDYFPPEGDR
ncbi:MAG: NADH-quinone oxidoreductase subunit D [Infirmifilum sp.]|jgi:NADH-quinone oxidoreductase subunit D|uniref:NADH dehydrogenase n=1 Tax=Infirmifilum uzonense TaxID=1550241 RepID=A0A0F7FIM0_9CREN|nr:NADH-quinone oxidoreductase subunit D [Infirmifilum uzonense]AKG38663.1 NADH dehydrogenase [Infirmifilum uzonense]